MTQTEYTLKNDDTITNLKWLLKYKPKDFDIVIRIE